MRTALGPPPDNQQNAVDGGHTARSVRFWKTRRKPKSGRSPAAIGPASAACGGLPRSCLACHLRRLQCTAHLLHLHETANPLTNTLPTWVKLRTPPCLEGGHAIKMLSTAAKGSCCRRTLVARAKKWEMPACWASAPVRMELPGGCFAHLTIYQHQQCGCGNSASTPTGSSDGIGLGVVRVSSTTVTLWPLDSARHAPPERPSPAQSHKPCAIAASETPAAWAQAAAASAFMTL